jgi:putative glutamine amidotransferase
VTSSRRRALLTMLLNRIALWRAGARTVRLYPGRERSLDDIDGVLIGGGDDISVELYDRELRLDTRVDPERDALELRVLQVAAERGLPVLGICRGAQMLNVFRGGSLHVDIHAVYEELPRLRTILPRKQVSALRGSRLRALVGRDAFRVNSLHHQAVRATGEGLHVVARDEYGVVQAIEDDRGRAAIGVQWHPEFLVLNRGQQGLFRWLVTRAHRCRQRRAEQHAL